MKRLLSLLCLLIALALLGGACASVEPAAATVNGEEITEEELREELDAIRENEAYLQILQQPGDPTQAPLQVLGRGQGTLDAGFVARVLSRQILLELIHQEFLRLDLELSNQELDEARQQIVTELGEDIVRKFPAGYRDTIVRRNAEVTKLQAALAEVDIDEEAIRAYYEENRSRFELNCASHILVDTREQAEQLKAQIDAGASFEDLARASSTDTASAQNGGKMECQPTGTFVPEFEQAIDTLRDGEISGPVQTQFGFHLIRRDGKRVQTIEEVEPQIRQELLGQAQGQFATFITEAAQKAKVTVNSRYGTFDRQAGPTGAVVPPVAPTTSRPPPTSEQPQPQFPG